MNDPNRTPENPSVRSDSVRGRLSAATRRKEGSKSIVQDVKKGAYVILLVIAVFADTLQWAVSLLHFIPIAGSIAVLVINPMFTVFFTLLFFFLFFMIGEKFISPKRIAALGGATLIEFIPIINLIPSWTLTIFLLTFGKETIQKLTDKAGKIGG